VTLDTVNLEIDALTLDSSFAVSLANALFDETDYITVVSKTGVIKMKSILIDSVDTSTGVVTVDTDFVYEDGETIEVGDYVVHGKYATTHSELPEICERYLLEFGYKRIFYRDSSQDWQIAHQELVQSRVDIIDAIASMTSDVNYIPEIINWEDY
jgi:hypothetical protein